MAPSLTGRVALLLGACGVAHGVRLKSHSGLDAAGTSSTRRLMSAFSQKIRLRFSQVDTDGDGVVSLEEMRRGFGHEPVHAGRDILDQMLSECSGVPGERVKSCAKEQLERSLAAWEGSHAAVSSLHQLRQDSEGGFEYVADEGGQEAPCGPSAETPAPGLEGVNCTVQGARCFRWGNLVAWTLNDVCQERACICEPTSETKRLAKLGVMGALGVTSAINFTDPDDKLLPPSCGSDWKAFKINGKIENLQKLMGPIEKTFARTALPHFVDPSFTFKEIKLAETEVALYKSARHRVSKGGPHQKVCMISWQATRSLGDWLSNVIITEVPLRYAPKGVKVMLPKGLEITYASAREELKRTFEAECCSPDFQADKLVISGHSHGGAMAEINAMDAVTNWACGGRDLGAKEVSVVLTAPHAGMLRAKPMNQIFSCNDASACLAGSVVTLVTHGDFVGDKPVKPMTGNAPLHPSKVTRLPCPAMLPDANYKNETPADRFEMFWCHGIFNYVPLVEQKLVGEAGWGSSCDGDCGDPNRMVQCNLWSIMGKTGCSYSEAEYLKPTTPCPSSRWLPAEERCDCDYQRCTDLTTHGCAA